MAKKAKRAVKRTKKVIKAPKKNIILWKWIIILLPLIVAILWVIAILSAREQIPLVYEQASPEGVSALLILILLFIVSYGTFAFMTFRKIVNKVE